MTEHLWNVFLIAGIVFFIAGTFASLFVGRVAYVFIYKGIGWRSW